MTRASNIIALISLYLQNDAMIFIAPCFPAMALGWCGKTCFRNDGMRVMTDKLPWRPAPDGVEREKGPNSCGWGLTGHELMVSEICEISCFTSFLRILSKYHEDKAENSASVFFLGGIDGDKPQALERLLRTRNDAGRKQSHSQGGNIQIICIPFKKMCKKWLCG